MTQMRCPIGETTRDGYIGLVAVGVNLYDSLDSEHVGVGHFNNDIRTFIRIILNGDTELDKIELYVESPFKVITPYELL